MPFSDEISGLAIITLLDKSTQSVIMLKVKFMQNAALLDIMNSSSKILILNLKEALGILRPQIIRILKNKAGSTTAKFK